MNNSKNPKMLGLKFLRQTQILSQNGEISTQERVAISSCIKEGMTTGNFKKLKDRLLELLETTNFPEMVEEMIMEI